MMPAIDPFAGYPPSKVAPFDNCFIVVKSDTEDLPFIASCLYIIDDPEYILGDQNDPTQPDSTVKKLSMKVDTAGGQTLLFKTAGYSYITDMRFRRVWATGTDAVKILAYY